MRAVDFAGRDDGPESPPRHCIGNSGGGVRWARWEWGESQRIYLSGAVHRLHRLSGRVAGQSNFRRAVSLKKGTSVGAERSGALSLGRLGCALDLTAEL